MTDSTRILADGPPAAGGRVRAAGEPLASPLVTLLGTVHQTGQLATILDALQLTSAGRVDEGRSPNADRSPVTIFNDQLLRHIGARAGHFPPQPEPDWELDPELETMLASASAALQASIGSGASYWHDINLPLLLPFWRRVLRDQLVVILSVAAPSDAIEPTDETTSTVIALARYERLVRATLDVCGGLRVQVVDANRLAHDPDLVAKDLAAFLDTSGVPTGDLAEALDRLGASSAPAPKTSTPDHAAQTAVLAEITALYEKVNGLVGTHGCFEPPHVGEESPWVRALLRAEDDLEHVVEGLVWTTRHIEPIIRSEPRLEPVPVATPARTSEEMPDELETQGIDDDRPYPLNAAEDRRAYHRWLRARHLPVVVDSPDEATRRKARTRAPLFATGEPLVSILVPVWRPPLWALERCIESVLAQSFGDWQLCLCDDASGDEDLTSYLRSLRRRDRRITVTALEDNSGISAATNRALKVARGRFIAFLDHDDEFAPHALAEVARAIEANPEADLLYSDEDKIDSAGERFDPLFKPDWSPDLLLSFAYVCHLTVVRRKLLDELGGLRSEFDGSQDYDLSIRASERARKIVHIPEVLYHWRTLPGSAARDTPGAVAKPWAYEAGRRAIEDALQRRGEQGEVSEVGGFPGRYHVRRSVASEPLVSIIIPFRDEPALLATCATSLRANPGYDRFEMLLVDNGSELPETKELLDRLSGEDGIRVIESPGPFNWASINNDAVKEARGDVLLFSNNDIEARVPRWLDALLGHAMRPEVGAVGARLVYPDGVIQHAGVVIGLGGIAGHVLRGLPGEHPGYNSMAIQTRNCSVVTGACMMTRREVFEAAGGFDELLPVAFNDVDYCLKLREQGYLIVYTPLAELVHHESRSRGHTDDLVESRRIVARWGRAIVAGDPYMSVHLSHWRYWCPLSTAQEDHRWQTYLETSVSTRASSSNT